MIGPEEMLLEVRREIALRRRVYPRWVEAGRLKLDRAERQIEVMEAVAAALASPSVVALLTPFTVDAPT